MPIHDPAVLILDEPAAGLDPRARIELREMIARLAADGKTILGQGRDLSELAEMCDTVGIIEQGRLLAVGSVDDIQRGAPGQGASRQVDDRPRRYRDRPRFVERRRSRGMAGS